MLAKFNYRFLVGLALITITAFLSSKEVTAQTPELKTQIAGPPESILSTTYREPRSAIFADPTLISKSNVTPTRMAEPIAVTVVTPPSFEERDLIWKEKRTLAAKKNLASPSPSEKYLVSEVKILGVYQKPEGQGVFLRPTLSMSTTIFAMIGQQFWNGQITKINKDSIEVEIRSLLNTGKYKTEIQTIPFTRGK